MMMRTVNVHLWENTLHAQIKFHSMMHVFTTQEQRRQKLSDPDIPWCDLKRLISNFCQS